MKLQIMFIIASIGTFWFVLRRIRKRNLNIEDSISWILWALLLLLFSIIPQIPTYISSKLGFMSTSNFVLTMFIFFLYLMLFAQNVKISELKDKNKDLVQRLSIRDYEEYLEMKKQQEMIQEKNEN